MAFIKLLFVLMILVPVAILMLFLINKLLSDFSESIKREYGESPEERARRKGRRTESYGENHYGSGYSHGSRYSQRNNTYETYGRSSSLEGNPSYEAYREARSRQEEKKERSVYTQHSENDRRTQVNKRKKRSGNTGRRKSRKNNRKD